MYINYQSASWFLSSLGGVRGPFGNIGLGAFYLFISLPISL
jgi:hypothetical protein